MSRSAHSWMKALDDDPSQTTSGEHESEHLRTDEASSLCESIVSRSSLSVSQGHSFDGRLVVFDLDSSFTICFSSSLLLSSVAPLNLTAFELLSPASQGRIKSSKISSPSNWKHSISQPNAPVHRFSVSSMIPNASDLAPPPHTNSAPQSRYSALSSNAIQVTCRLVGENGACLTPPGPSGAGVSLMTMLAKGQCTHPLPIKRRRELVHGSYFSTRCPSVRRYLLVAR